VPAPRRGGGNGGEVLGSDGLPEMMLPRRRVRLGLLATAALIALAAALIITIIVGPVSADPVSYRNQVLADAPSGYWRLGEAGSATTAADQTGANPGTYLGGVTLGRPGALADDADTAAGPDGASGTVRIADAAGLNPTSALTLEAWIRPRSLPGSAATILRKDGQYALRLKSNGALIFRLWKNGIVQDVVTGSGLARVGAWAHVVGTWDGATMTIYVNGVARATAPMSAPVDTTTSRLWLASTYQSFDWLDADLDEVAVYPTALSAARVQSHYQTAVPPPPPPTSQYAGAVLADAPSGYWRLGEAGSATTAADQTGANPGTYLGGVTLGRPGALAGDADTAAGFDGASGTVRIADAAGLDPTSALTLEAWIRPSALPASSNVILRKEDQYALRLTSTGALVFRLWKGDVTQDVVTSAGAARVGAWTHVVGTWDGATMTIYVNGDPKAGRSLAAPIDTAGTGLFLGSTYNSFDYFAGTVDEVAVYPTALSAARLQSHYQTAVPPPPPPTSQYAGAVLADAPSGYWRLAETGSASTAADQTGTNPGTYLGGLTLGRPGALAGDADTAATFDGASGTVQIANAAGLNPTSALTLEAWIRPSVFPVSSNAILRKDGQYALRLRSNGALVFRLWKGDVSQDVVTGASAARVGAWTHVVGTWDGATMTIYVNGDPKASQPLSAPIDTAGSGLFLGSTYNSFDWFTGDMDEVAVYGKALTAARVAAHYLSAIQSDTTPPVIGLGVPASASTMDATPTFGGTAGTLADDSSRVTVSIFAGSSTTGTPLQVIPTSTDQTGLFSVKTPSPLGSGTYTAVAEQRDVSGNTGRSTTTFGVDASADPSLTAAGDIARCDSSDDEATGQLLDRLPGTVAAVGDLAYDSGSTSAFLNCYGPSWGRQRARTRPALGDHEYETGSAAAYFAYFGAAAGDPSKGYYSYEIGSWHIVVLNTNCAEVGGCGSGSLQDQWLLDDLTLHPAACTLAYFHAPRFSSGQNGSSTDSAQFWQDLYDAGADVVLSGDDHDYERFAPQAPDGTLDTARGIREFVVGTGGGSRQWFNTDEPNSEVRDSAARGVLSLTLHAGSFDWRFVPAAGTTFTDSGSQSCH
jgi:hypothetical protein